MERLIGAHCYLGYVAISEEKMSGISRIDNGWILFNEEVAKKDFSIAWIERAFTCVPSKVTLEERWLILHTWTKLKFHVGWTEFLCHVGCARITHSILQAGRVVGGQDTKGGRQTALNPTSNEPDEYQDLSRPRKVHYKSKWKVTQDATHWINLRRAQGKGSTFWQT